MYSTKIPNPTAIPRSRPRRLVINADIEVDAARDSTTQVINWTTAQTSATGNTDHGTPIATAAPNRITMLASGR